MAMTFESFQASLGDTDAPAGMTPPLSALWHLAKGNWNQAHKIVQDEDDTEAAWVHAHLHRVEGDEGNAGYWYRRAGRPHATSTTEDEWRQIVADLL